jgi:hypothetical protein
MANHLNFEDNPLLDRLPGLLRDHDYLHDMVEELTERDNGHDRGGVGPHTPEHTDLNVQVTANLHELAAILGISGIRGLLHLVDEMLLEVGVDGLDLDDPQTMEAMAHMVDIPTQITKSLAVIALFDGKVPNDRAVVDAKLEELLERGGLIIQLG